MTMLLCKYLPSILLPLAAILLACIVRRLRPPADNDGEHAPIPMSPEDRRT